MHTGEPPDTEVHTTGHLPYTVPEDFFAYIHPDFTIRTCINEACGKTFVANKITYRLKSCPPCHTGTQVQVAAVEVAPSLLPKNPLEQLRDLIHSDGSIVEKVLASATYSHAFQLSGSVELEIANGLIVNASKFNEACSTVTQNSEDILGDDLG